MKMNRHTLKKVELVLEEIGYEVIYEKGNFKSGYCLVENKNIAVINKFYDVEARINCIIDIIDNVDFDPILLSKESKKFLRQKTHQEPSLPFNEKNALETH